MSRSTQSFIKKAFVILEILKLAKSEPALPPRDDREAR